MLAASSYPESVKCLHAASDIAQCTHSSSTCRSPQLQPHLLIGRVNGLTKCSKRLLRRFHLHCLQYNLLSMYIYIYQFDGSCRRRIQSHRFLRGARPCRTVTWQPPAKEPQCGWDRQGRLMMLPLQAARCNGVSPRLLSRLIVRSRRSSNIHMTRDAVWHKSFVAPGVIITLRSQ